MKAQYPDILGIIAFYAVLSMVGADSNEGVYGEVFGNLVFTVIFSIIISYILVYFFKILQAMLNSFVNSNPSSSLRCWKNVPPFLISYDINFRCNFKQLQIIFLWRFSFSFKHG